MTDRPMPRRRPRPAWSGVAAALLVTVGAHALFLSTALGSDEGGFAMVARHWAEPGAYLYGPQWVDRPPLLIALFAAAIHLGGYGVRVLALLCAVALVAAIAWAAWIAGGRVAATWTAWAATALVSSPLFGAHQLNGELAAVPFVALSVASTLASVRRPRLGLGLALLAGASATCAVLVKQNFVGGFAFAIVYLLLTARRRIGWRRGGLLIAAWAAGTLVVVGAAALWAARHGGVDALLYAMYGFRLDAARVIAEGSLAAPQHRLGQLTAFAIASGLVPVVLVLATAHLRRLRRPDPVPWAIGAALLVEVVGVVGGGNFWGHYLIGPVPMVALATGLAARHGQRRWRWVRGAVVAATVSMLLAGPVTAFSGILSAGPDDRIAAWLRASARAGDSLVVPFSHAGIIEMSGLAPRYPYSWSLPVRTLDPDLDLLVATLAGPDAPTWVVRWDGPHSWGLDPRDRVERVLEERYRHLGEICGRPVWLLAGEPRDPAPPPPEQTCRSELEELLTDGPASGAGTGRGVVGELVSPR